MLVKYGFSKNYINNYKNDCILAIKRKLGYRSINSSINDHFMNDFKHLIK